MENGKILAYSYILSVFLYYIDTTETVKYFQYILPVIALFSCIKKPKSIYRHSEDEFKLLYIFVSIIFVNFITILMNDNIYVKFFQESYLLIGSLFFSIALVSLAKNYIQEYINLLFVGLIVIFLITKGSFLLNVLLEPSLIYTGILSSTLATESSLSFYFSILSFCFVIKNDKKRLLLSILFMLLSFKRIAIVAFVICIIAYFVTKLLNISYNRKVHSLLLTSVNFSYIWILMLLINGNFDDFVKETFGVSPDFLFMGRINLYESVMSNLGDFKFFGNGIGRVADVLKFYNESGTTESALVNLHSDILKYYLELGILCFTVFMYYFIYLLSKTKESFYFVALLNIILLTDNVSIYFGFMVLFFIINSNLSNSKNKISNTLITNQKIPIDFVNFNQTTIT